MKHLLILFIVLIFAACTGNEKSKTSYTIDKENFGQLPSGEMVTKYTMTATPGISISIINYGGIITSIFTPDKSGQVSDVVLGYDNIDQYVESSPYFGAIIGRYGNRIANGEFSLDGESFKLATNNGANHLHGGIKGFDKVLWQVEKKITSSSAKLILTRESPDGEEGYPGRLTVKVVYTLEEGNTLNVSYEASTSKKTVVNLTNHSYFNLSGQEQSVEDHELTINSSRYLPVDSTLIPTGLLKGVANTAFDFRKPKKVGLDINSEEEQVQIGKGFDHCWVIDPVVKGQNFVARLFHEPSGRQMEVYSEEPGVQFYSGNFLNGSRGKNGINYHKRSGLCLETQHFPDSPNQSKFPSVILLPGQKYTTSTKMVFSVIK